MRKTAFIILGVILLITLSAATTTTQPSKTDILKAEWNRTICIALHVLQILSVGIAVLLIMVAGLKYMSSEDVSDKSEAKNLVLRVLSILVVIAIAAQVVNYMVAGTRIGSVDLDSCKDLFPSTTRGGGGTTTPTTATTTTIGNGTTTTTSSVGTTSSTTTTMPKSCDDPSNPQGIYGSANVCEKVKGVCKSDLGDENYAPPPNGRFDVDDILGIGFAQCCCNNGYPDCCK